MKGTSRATRRAVAIGVLMFFIGLYGLTFHGYVDVEDVEVAFQSTRNLVENGSLAIPDTEEGRRAIERDFYVVRAQDGRHYPIYPLAQMLYEVPFYVAGRAMSDWAQEKPEDVIRMAFTSVDVFAGALTCMMIFLITAQLGYSPRLAAWTALLSGAGTMLWAYAQGCFPDMPLTLCIASSVWCLLRGPDRVGWLLAAGTFHALASLIRPVGLLLLLPSLWSLRREGPWRCALFLAPVVVLWGTMLALDAGVFGRPLSASYAAAATNAPPLLTFSYTLSLFGLLFSDGRGLFVLSPVLLLSLFAWPALHRAHPRAGGLVLGHLLTLALFFAAFDGWYGGWCWGPRYLLPAVPLLGVALAAWLEQAAWWRRVLTVSLVAVSLWIQILSIAVPHRMYMTAIASAPADITQFFYYSRFSPVLAHQKILARKLAGEPDTFSNRWLFGAFDDTPIDMTAPISMGINRYNLGFDHFAWVRVFAKGHRTIAILGVVACWLCAALGLVLIRRATAHPLPIAMRSPNNADST